MDGSTSLSNIFHSSWKHLYFYITSACKWSYLPRSRRFGGRIFLIGFKCCRSVSKVRQWANKLKPSDDILSKHLQTLILLPQFSWKQLLLRNRLCSAVDSCFPSASKLRGHNFCFLNGFKLLTECHLQLVNTAHPGLSCPLRHLSLQLWVLIGPSIIPHAQKWANHHCLVQWWSLKARVAEGSLVQWALSVENICATVTEPGRVQTTMRIQITQAFS